MFVISRLDGDLYPLFWAADRGGATAVPGLANDAGPGADVLRHEIGMPAQPVAGSFNLDDHGLVKQPIE
jgi:hypothetical protein